MPEREEREERECLFCGQGCTDPFQVDNEYDEDNDGPLDRLIHEAELAAMCGE